MGWMDTTVNVHAYDLYPTLLDGLGIKPGPMQKMDGISMMPALTQTGPLAREGVFHYFPHSLFGIPPGVSVRAGDWKLIRWYETNAEHPNTHELYNLKDDIGETKNLAGQIPDKVRHLDAAIDGFLATGEVVPKPNPAFRSKVADASATTEATDPLQGWKTQNCRATLANGSLHIEADGQPPFLGISQLSHLGPVMLRLSAKSAGGRTKVQWRTSKQKTFPTGQVVDFTLPASAHGEEVGIELPIKGALLHLRLYLPVQTQPVDLNWVELCSSRTGAKPQRWNFDKK